MAELLQIFIDNIAPILVIAAIGFLVGRQLEIDPRPLSKLLLNVLSPALVYQSISTSQISSAELVQLTAAVGLFVAAMTALAYGITRYQGENRLNQAAVILAAICPNNGNFGLPVIALAFNSEVLARAAVVFVLVTMSNYSVGVFMASSGRTSLRMALLNILRVPPVYAAVAGLLVNFTGLSIPAVIAEPVFKLSQATVPMMLLMLGLQLSRSAPLSRLNLVGLGVGLRLLISPLLAASFALLIGLNDVGTVALIMQASMPVAVVTIILASEYNLDHQLSLSMIFASTLLSPLTLSLLIFALSQFIPSAV